MGRATQKIRTKYSKPKAIKFPDFYFERNLWNKGYKVIAGCDEVGRGCFAGPVIAGACVFSRGKKLTYKSLSLQGIKINDSKKLSCAQREKADKWIKSNCMAWGIGVGSVAEINRTGIVKATNSAFRRSIKALMNTSDIRVDYLLVDAFYIPYIRNLSMPRNMHRSVNKKVKEKRLYKFSGRQMAIISGDEKSLSIAAASIIAKVYRDKLMARLADFFPDYGWQNNKGYGTEIHRDAIIRNGLTRHHRKQFVQTFIKNSAFFPVRSKT